MKKNHNLSEFDKKVWDEFSRNIRKLPKSELVEKEFELKKKLILGEKKTDHNAIETNINQSRVKLKKHPPLDAVVARKKFRALKKGKITPQASLDLHGLSRKHAYDKVMIFLFNSIKKKLRLILIITGKGKISQDYGSTGILRKELPTWISSSQYSDKILGISPASNIHGGAGAYYVYIRKTS